MLLYYLDIVFLQKRQNKNTESKKKRNKQRKQFLNQYQYYWLTYVIMTMSCLLVPTNIDWKHMLLS